MRPGVLIASTIAGFGLAAGSAVLLPEHLSRTGARAAVPQQEAIQPVARTVLVTAVQMSRGSSVRSFPATIAAKTESQLAFRVAGKVGAKMVSVGDRIAAGAVIAKLDDTDFQLQLESAEAELSAARIALATETENLTRIESLKSGGWATDRATDLGTAATEEARSRLLRAERNVQLARNQIGYATLRAAEDGVVTHEFVEVGQVVAAGQPIVEAANDGEREAVIAIPEALLSDFRDADATVELWSSPEKRLTAVLTELSPVADPVTRTFQARFRLEDPTGSAALGMSATVWLSRDGQARRAELPLAALNYGDGGASVWVVGPNERIESRDVTIAGFGADTVRISDGLSENEKVVVLGAHKLTDGEPVRPVLTGERS